MAESNFYIFRSQPDYSKRKFKHLWNLLRFWHQPDIEADSEFTYKASIIDI